MLLANGSCLLRRPLRWLVTAWTSLQQWSWPLAVGLLAGLWLLLGTTTELLQDPDTLLHLKIGAWIHSHGAVPHVDVFSHTRYGAPWVAHEWLAACLMAAAHRLGGWTALMVGTVAVFTLTLAGLTRWLLQRLPPIYALLLVALAAAPLSAHLLARPHVLSWPLLLVWTIGLVQAREANGPSKWLLLVMVVWANLHGSFTLGLLLAGGFALEAVMAAWGDRALLAKQVRAWVFFCVLSVGAAMITPYGWQGLGLTLQVTGLSHLQDIAEWAPPSGAGLVPVMLWGTVITALSVLGLLRMPLARWGLLAGLVYQASTASRMGSMLGLLAPVLMAGALGHGLRAKTSATQQAGSSPSDRHTHAQTSVSKVDVFFNDHARPASWAACCVASLCLAFAAVAMHAQGRYSIPVPMHISKALQALKKAYPMGVSGHVFNDYNLGAALIDQGISVFVDGRADVYGNALLHDYFETVRSTDPQKIERIFCTYGIGWTMLGPTTALADYLNSSPGWTLVYQDQVSVVHVGNGSAPCRAQPQ